jgi:hypothetical protein
MFCFSLRNLFATVPEFLKVNSCETQAAPLPAPNSVTQRRIGMKRRLFIAAAFASALAPAVLSAQKPVPEPKNFKAKVLRDRKGRPERLRIDGQQFVRRHI